MRNEKTLAGETEWLDSPTPFVFPPEGEKSMVHSKREKSQPGRLRHIP